MYKMRDNNWRTNGHAVFKVVATYREQTDQRSKVKTTRSTCHIRDRRREVYRRQTKTRLLWACRAVGLKFQKTMSTLSDDLNVSVQCWTCREDRIPCRPSGDTSRCLSLSDVVVWVVVTSEFDGDNSSREATRQTEVDVRSDALNMHRRLDCGTEVVTVDRTATINDDYRVERHEASSLQCWPNVFSAASNTQIYDSNCCCCWCVERVNPRDTAVLWLLRYSSALSIN